jgi:hypothetical protein
MTAKGSVNPQYKEAVVKETHATVGWSGIEGDTGTTVGDSGIHELQKNNEEK